MRYHNVVVMSRIWLMFFFIRKKPVKCPILALNLSKQNTGTTTFSPPPCLSQRRIQKNQKWYTDTKVNELFRAPARMSVIKLLLAGNTISFCGLNKLFAIAGSSPGILKIRFVYLFPDRNFPRNSPTPTRNIWNGLVFLFPDRSFPGLFPFPAWNYLGSLDISKQEKLQAPGIEPLTFW